MRAQPPSGTKAKGAKRTKMPPMAYLALHGTDLALAIAAGALHADLGGAERGQALLFVDSSQLPLTLGNARRGRDYGVVALVEVARERLSAGGGKDQSAVDGTWHYVPLAMVSRILFQSTGDCDEFRARASGYGDVPVDVLEYHIEPALFAEGGATLFHEPVVAGKEDMQPVPGVGEARTIDKLAGTASAYLAAVRGLPGDPRAAADFEAACKATTAKGTPDELIRALAMRLDPSADNAVNAGILAVAAQALESVEPSAGFDADTFLASFGAKFEPGSDEQRIARKFVDRAQAVLSGNTEVANDAFADYPGKTILRALLLFLLNPDASRLQTVGKRLGSLGPSVRMLASALAGCMAGFAALAVALKAPSRGCHLSLPLLAKLVHDGRFVGFESSQSWCDDASGEARLCLGGHAIMALVLPAAPMVVALRKNLAALGHAPKVDPDNGAVVWSEPSLKGVPLQARACKAPVFPGRDGIEIAVRLQGTSPRRDVLASVANTNARARQSGVFATGMARGRSLELELCVVCDSIEMDAVAFAVRALAAEVEATAIRLETRPKLVDA